MYQRILLATDFSESSRHALRAAVSLARAALASIEALYVDVPRFPSFAPHGAGEQAELEQRFASFFPPEIYPRSKRQIVVGHSVTGEILRFAKAQECDLIVLGSHGHSALERLLLGSITQQVTRGAEIPVLVVHSFPSEATNFDSVLVPTDFSPAAMMALEYGVRFANFLKADFHFVHVVDLPALEEVHSQYLIERFQLPSTCELNVDSVLKKTLESFEMDGQVSTATLSGDPSHEILRYIAEHGIDWVVMGTHGRKGLERLLLGSVTSGVISKSTAPVLTLSHHG